MKRTRSGPRAGRPSGRGRNSRGDLRSVDVTDARPRAPGAVAETNAGGSGILRIGTTSYIDSFNPWNYIEGQGLNAMMIMAYPLLMETDYSKKEGYFVDGDWAKWWKVSGGGEVWTFELRPNTRWSDGKRWRPPMLSGLSTRRSSTRTARPQCGHDARPREERVGADPTTLVVRYEARSATLSG